MLFASVDVCIVTLINAYYNVIEYLFRLERADSWSRLVEFISISRLKAYYHGQSNFDLRLLTFDLSTQKLLFTDVLIP